jgi:hypothetical protein
MKQRIRLTEGDLHRIVKEAIVKEAKKKVPKKGKIKFNNEWVDATEDKPDRYGNPMFKIKDKGKPKRVQNFNFRPNKVEESVIRLTEGDLHRIVKESVKRILKEQQIGGSSAPGYEFDYETGQVKSNSGGAFGGSESDKARDYKRYLELKKERERTESPSYQEKKDWCIKNENYLREMCPGYWGDWEKMYDRYRSQLGA